MEGEIRAALSDAIVYLGAGTTTFTLERPPDLAHGDYATNAALAAARRLSKDPRALAEELARALAKRLGPTAKRVEAAGPGFVNIALSRAAINLCLTEADAQGASWGRKEPGGRARVSVEYGNPNPFKEMHVGHLMSVIIGEALSRLIEAEGATVVRGTFGGDVGPHVAKALWQLRAEGVFDIESARQIGEAYARGAAAYEENEEAKRAIDGLNAQLYGLVARQADMALSEDERALLALWRQGREISMEEFRRIFTMLGTRFAYEFFDSDTTDIGMRVVKDGLARGVFEKSDGAVIYRGERAGLHTLVFLTSRGTPTYESKDLGLAFLKQERVNAEKDLIVTAAEQIGHFKVVLAALAELAPELAKKTRHVPHGLLRLASGKMSSRKGNVITAAKLLADLARRAAKKNPDPLVAEQVAVGAVKYLILRQAPGQDIVFDAEKSLSLEGDSGPYLQYALVRAKSVLAHAEKPRPPILRAGSEEPSPFARLIIHYPETIARAAREFAPNLLTAYLTELAGAWNSFYARTRIIGSEQEAERLMLTRAFAHTMENGLGALGIPAPQIM